MTTGDSDLELLDRWGRGDRSAGAELLERHFDALYRFFCNKAQDGVEDLMQQTMLACVEGRARFRGDSSFRTYMFRAARLELYDYYSRRSRGATPVELEMTSVADLGTSPSGVLARRQDERVLLEALRRIPLPYQIVLELSLWEELSGAEIGEILEIPEGTVRSRLRLAMDRLREQMQLLGGPSTPMLDTADDLQAWAARMRGGLGRSGEE